jgi:DhnA family fructose-bisphosphate aldolase class Ia
MTERIAVEPGLDYVKEYLTGQGYDVVDLGSGSQHAAAVILSGLDENYLGTAKASTKAPVINAEGRSPQEILADLKARLQKER